jgi:Fic family protein
MGPYIWQSPSWPTFTWDTALVSPLLQQAKQSQDFILDKAHEFKTKDELTFFTEEAFHTSAIEGEILDKKKIRSSVAKRLTLETTHFTPTLNACDGLVEVLIDATKNFQQKLTHKRLYSWQASFFPESISEGVKIRVGSYRIGDRPMQLISGPKTKMTIHYEAPPSHMMKKEMKIFLNWWNHSTNDEDGIIRAAVAHLWFVTIHPFDDGNGRIARALTYMALAQEEKIHKRLYSLSLQIFRDDKNYYRILEKTQKGTGDITEWIMWFLQMFMISIENSKKIMVSSTN